MNVLAPGFDNPELFGIVIPMNAAHAAHLVIIPCAAAKVDAPAAARDLYDSANFRHALRAAEATAADQGDTKVMILSAEHGLVELDTVLAPYDTKMGRKGAVAVEVIIDQLVSLAPATITSMLPSAYFQPIWEAVTFINEEGSDEDPWIALMDVYEASPGIGFQRGTSSSLLRIMAA